MVRLLPHFYISLVNLTLSLPAQVTNSVLRTEGFFKTFEAVLELLAVCCLNFELA